MQCTPVPVTLSGDNILLSISVVSRRARHLPFAAPNGVITLGLLEVIFIIGTDCYKSTDSPKLSYPVLECFLHDLSSWCSIVKRHTLTIICLVTLLEH